MALGHDILRAPLCATAPAHRARHSLTPEDLPRILSRRAWSLWLWLGAAADESGLVPLGPSDVARALHVTPVTVRRGIRELREQKPRLAWARRGRVYVNRGAWTLAREGRCEACGEASTSGRWCARCKQHQRSDRAWRVRAVELAVAGKSPMEISVALGVSLWGDPEAGRIRDASESGVVPYLVAHHAHLIGAEWVTRWAEAKRGE